MDIGPLEPKVPDLIVAAICFALVFALFAKFLLPRLVNVLAERTDAIEGKIERAEEAQLEAERIHNEYKNELAEARRELAHVRQEALEQGAAIIAAAREESARQRDALIADAQAQIEVDRALAAAELTESVRHLAIDLAGRIVGEPLDEFASNSEVIDRYLEELDAKFSPKGTTN
ncbi:F0F1 ATP synthase subunit B [Streptomyces sp. NPDC058424]|uniref:F0F1 ATP synthase subunit B n=1 Tax=Streptomyces sp. NPDC058424 TaxID=3346491 RepID=UPI0036503EB7